MHDLAIVVVSHNTRDLLRDCLASVPSGCTGISHKIYVIDNASTDGSPEMVAGEFPSTELRRSERDLGFAAANNLVLPEAAAAGRYIVLLNPDTIVRGDALAQLVRFMDSHPKAGYCGPRLLNGDGTHQFSAGRFLTILSDSLSILGLARDTRSRHTVDLHRLHGDSATFRTDWLVGACLLYRSEMVSTVGLLDERFFMYYEEVDWCLRMANAGWEGWYIGAAEVTHFGGQSIVHDDETRPFWGHQPRWHVVSYRRYMRIHHGWFGMIASEIAQIGAYCLVWLRNSVLFRDRTPRKAANAKAALRTLLTVPLSASRVKN